MKKQLISRILFFFGILILLYPVASHLYVMRLEKGEIKRFVDKTITTEEKEKISKEVEQRNKELKEGNFNTVDPFAQSESDSLNRGEPIGIIRIPKINIEYPIFEGSSEEVLSRAIGLLPKTSPIYGGKGTNTVLTGHRGTHDLDLFKNIDLLEKGDEIFIQNEIETLKYIVSNKFIIYPDQGDKIKLDAEKEKLTLITCHPYLINSKRLIIESERVPYSQEIGETTTAPNNLSFKHRVKLLSYREIILGILGVVFVVQLVRVVSRRRGIKDDTDK